MAKIITVIGGTGIQGGSVIRALLDSPDYTIRAITRNSSSDAAKALADKGVTVAEADINNFDSLQSALAGSHAIFAMTNFFDSLATLGIQGSMEAETSLGINLAKAAAATESLEHYVWSTLPNSRQNSDGKAAVPYYDSKNRVDDYIRSVPKLLAKTTFVWMGSYAGNMRYPIFFPTPINTMDGSKSYVQLINVPPSTLLPSLGDERVNAGLFVKAVLEQPQKSLPGKCVSGIVGYKTLGETMADFAKAQNIDARCVQIKREDYVSLWPVWAELMDVSYYYFEVAGRKSFISVDHEVLTKDDLNVKGLVGVAEAFAAMGALF